MEATIIERTPPPILAADPGGIDTRAAALAIRNEISSYNAYTTYDVRAGKLYVKAPGGLLDEQRELITTHRDMLVMLLTTPPTITGECIHGHVIDWQRDCYGVWCCSCSCNPSGQTDHITVAPSLAASTEPRQLAADPPAYEHQDEQHTERREPTLSAAAAPGGQDNAKQWGTIFVDVRTGQGITETGARFSFPADCSLSSLIEHARQIGPVNRVYVCGERPGDGISAQSYISWLMDAGMMDYYTTSKIGHHFDFNKPDMSVARYQFRAGRGALDIRRITSWLGDDRDANEQQLYTIEDARAALALVTKVLRQHFPLFRNLSGTPSTTFKHLWKQGNNIAKKQFPPLSETIRQLIHQNAGQGRIEYFPGNCQGKIPGLYYYDGIFEYAALTSELPTEIESHDTENTYAGKQSARYLIRFSVPQNWQHIGVFMTKRDGADWRDKDGWFYPGADHRGQAFETWVDGAELDACIQHYQDAIPDRLSKDEQKQWKAAAYARATLAAFQEWDITILERIVFKPTKESQVTRPLETITKKMIEIRAQLDIDKRQDTKNARIYELARGAVRNILLHGIGSFNRENKSKTYVLLPTDPAPAGFNRQATRDVLDDGRQVYTIPEEDEPDEMMHPEYAAAVWARCRARVTRQALAIPYTELVTIRTDAIATKTRQEHLEGGTKVGQFRRKWAIEKPLKAPESHEKFDLLQHKVLGK